MKFFLTLLITIAAFSLPAQAQTMVSKEQANTYFASCVENAAKTETRFSPQSQKMFCACTAARLTQFFSVEDMQTMTSPTDPNARVAFNKMIVDIYAPCMEEPTRERYYARCEKTSGMNQQICTCASDKIAVHMATQGSAIFTEMLARDPNIVDPWAALENDPAFNGFIDTATRSCLP